MTKPTTIELWSLLTTSELVTKTISVLLQKPTPVILVTASGNADQNTGTGSVTVTVKCYASSYSAVSTAGSAHGVISLPRTAAGTRTAL